MFWDGLKFFGTDVTKLKRLKRNNGEKPKPPRWYDKLLSIQWMTTTIVLLAITIFVLRQEVKLYGTVQIINKETVHSQNLTYNANETLPLMFTIYFKLDEVSEQLNIKNKNNA